MSIEFNHKIRYYYHYIKDNEIYSELINKFPNPKTIYNIYVWTSKNTNKRSIGIKLRFSL
jgi:hypothetical protein